MGKITGFMELERIAEVARAGRRARAPLPRVHPRARRRRGVEAGRALHGLRHPVLPDRLPGQQHHSGLERPRLPRSSGESALDVLHSTNNFPEFTGRVCPGAVRGGVHAQHQQRSGRHQVDRALHHRQGLGGRLGRAAAAGAQDRQARRRRRLGPGGPGVRAAARARRPRRRAVREGRPHRRAAALRHSRLQDGEAPDRPAHGADVERGRRVPPERRMSASTSPRRDLLDEFDASR